MRHKRWFLFFSLVLAPLLHGQPVGGTLTVRPPKKLALTNANGDAVKQVTVPRGSALRVVNSRDTAITVRIFVKGKQVGTRTVGSKGEELFEVGTAAVPEGFNYLIKDPPDVIVIESQSETAGSGAGFVLEEARRGVWIVLAAIAVIALVVVIAAAKRRRE